MLDDKPELGWRTGFEVLDNKTMHDSPLAHKGPVLKNNIPSEINISVRKNSASVTIDGSSIVSFNGDFNRLTPRFHADIPNNNALFVGPYKSVFHFTKIEITPLLPPTEPLRDATASVNNFKARLKSNIVPVRLEAVNGLGKLGPKAASAI